MDGEALRAVMRVFPQGVVVVTAEPPEGEERRGVTVSSFTSISLDPPLVMICIQKQAQAHEVIEKAGAFVVSVLADDQGAVSDHFATPNLSSKEQFAEVALSERSGLAPVIEGSLGHLDCKVVQTLAQADHTLFIGQVESGKVLKEGRPLVFFSRQYWGLGEEVHQRD